MKPFRLVARLDVKGKNLIKGINLEGLRVLGPPKDYALKYYHGGIDELIFMDTVASLYGRNHLGDLISATTFDVFVPITVGGGIRSVEDAGMLFQHGADKVAVNTAAVRNPDLISQITNKYGSQACVLSIEAKRLSNNSWEAFVDNGRERTGIDVLAWAQRAEKLGAGEILLTSVDQEGTKRGFDCQLVAEVSQAVSIPVIASGGLGSTSHIDELLESSKPDAIAVANVLHYDQFTIDELRQPLLTRGFSVRS